MCKPCCINCVLLSTELRSKIQELEHNLQTQTSDMKLHAAKLQEAQMQVENLKREMTEKAQALHKSNNEVTRITAQLDRTTAQVKCSFDCHV